MSPEPAAPPVPPPRTLGLLALGLVLVKTVEVLWRQPPADLLWVCHLGGFAIGAGLFLGLPALNAVGTLWLVFGLPMYGIALASGETVYPVSVLTHTLLPVIGVLGARRLGVPRQAWWQALLGLFAAQGLCRLLTPARDNVNLAFAIYPGWERHFPGYAVYWLFMSALAAGAFVTTQLALRRLTVVRP